ncbi:MAG: restriction endonuclease subunit M [Lachnospiraceae bacterium]|nr:restriction endonuclease subunit M [Lachnospiraceae bacterium]
MGKLIDINNYPVSIVLKSLLKDKTTRKNIIFATRVCTENGTKIDETEQITVELLKGFGNNMIQPRVLKSQETQEVRTRNKAEVFTPSWICNKMNNHCDDEWFGRKNVFNIEKDQTWEPTINPVPFKEKKEWQRYVDSKRLEITCGEAPYIVSRYDTTTAELIPISRRIGILDRKLRVVNENTENEKEWLKWAYRAFQSVYGYEFQGDNLLIARINLLNTFVDYMNDKWKRNPDEKELKKITNIIVWNLWQMDGITGTVPFGKPQERNKQITIFDYMVGINDSEPEQLDCKIYDWRSNESLTYRSLKGGRK